MGSALIWVMAWLSTGLLWSNIPNSNSTCHSQSTIRIWKGFSLIPEPSISSDPTKISFSLVNYRRANPPIDMPLNFTVKTSELSYSLPGMSHDVATNLSTRNNGYWLDPSMCWFFSVDSNILYRDGFQVNIVSAGSSAGATPLAQSGTFTLVEPGQLDSCESGV